MAITLFSPIVLRCIYCPCAWTVRSRAPIENKITSDINRKKQQTNKKTRKDSCHSIHQPESIFSIDFIESLRILRTICEIGITTITVIYHIRSSYYEYNCNVQSNGFLWWNTINQWDPINKNHEGAKYCCAVVD